MTGIRNDEIPWLWLGMTQVITSQREIYQNNHKSKAERLKGDPYIGVCFQALETLERLCLIQTRVNY